MATLRSVRLQHFRVHDDRSIDLAAESTIITGKNGSGKTSLIEAIYLGLQGSSFKGTDSEVLARTESWWRVDMTWGDETERSVKFDSERTTGRKQFIVGGKTMYRLAPHYRYPVVLFEPDDLRLLHGSPTRRRDFIDRFISQLDPLYHQAVRKYERALKQRNTLLKRPDSSDDDIFTWDVALSEYGSYIIEQRINFIEQINQQLADAYNDIAHSGDIVEVHYSYTLIGNIKQKLMSDLFAHRAKDRLLGFTSIGPHRHDLVFHHNTSPALTVASRGEVRSIVLALKFIELSILARITAEQPLVLLDDVFSELDAARREQLIASMKQYQTIITDTHTLKADRFYHIQL